MIAKDMINASLRILGSIASGESATHEELSDAFLVLKEMLHEWKLEYNIIPLETLQFSTVAGEHEYSLNTEEPEEGEEPNGWTGEYVNVPQSILSISSVKITDSGYGYKLAIEPGYRHDDIYDLTDQGRPKKAYPIPMPQFFLLKFWPVPDKVYPVTLKYVSQGIDIASYNDRLPLSDFYLSAIRYNLATRLSDEYGIQLNQNIVFRANDSLKLLQKAYAKPIPQATFEKGLLL